MDYPDVLTRTADRAVVLPPDSEAERAAIEGFRRLFAEFTPAGVRAAAGVYAEDAWFNDTLKTVQGRDAIADYLAESAEACEACRVDIQSVARDGIDRYVRWEMMIRFKKIARGRDTHSIGITQVRFDASGSILMHQDFWDAAQGFYRYVPVLGAGIRYIRGRL